MAKILVAGGTGLLGCTVAPLLRTFGHHVLTLARGTHADVRANLLDQDSVLQVFTTHRPEIVIHMAAATDVDGCERDPQVGFEGNVLSVSNISGAVRSQSPPPHLIYMSTDHVYNGEKSAGPQREHAVNIVNYYAMTKYAGELAALRSSCTVLRTNFFGLSLCAGRSTFSDWLVSRAESSITTPIFTDVWFSALRMTTLAYALDAVCSQRHAGIFNLGTRGMASKAEFAKALLMAMGLNTSCLRDSTVDEARLLAQRPRNMAMDVSHFQNTFNFTLPTLEEEITAVAQEYQHVKYANPATRH